MQKAILLLPILIGVPLRAMALPAIGDVASYTTSTVGGAQAGSGTEEDAITGFDPSSGQYQEQVTTQPSGGQASVQQNPAKGLLTLGELNWYVSRCAGLGGTIQVVAVPAGVFQTCMQTVSMPGMQVTTWTGHVPFGVVKSQSTNAGVTVIKTLTNYSFGNTSGGN